MKDQMMLGEKEFLKAVLIIMILVMTFVCLHLFVLKSDAAEISKVRMNTTSIQDLKTVRSAGLETTTHKASIA
jgi:hypothetical protein